MIDLSAEIARYSHRRIRYSDCSISIAVYMQAVTKYTRFVMQMNRNFFKKNEKEMVAVRDENGSDTDRYHRYYICFHISVWIRLNPDSVNYVG